MGECLTLVTVGGSHRNSGLPITPLAQIAEHDGGMWEIRDWADGTLRISRFRAGRPDVETIRAAVFLAVAPHTDGELDKTLAALPVNEDGEYDLKGLVGVAHETESLALSVTIMPLSDSRGSLAPEDFPDEWSIIIATQCQQRLVNRWGR